MGQEASPPCSTRSTVAFWASANPAVPQEPVLQGTSEPPRASRSLSYLQVPVQNLHFRDEDSGVPDRSPDTRCCSKCSLLAITHLVLITFDLTSRDPLGPSSAPPPCSPESDGHDVNKAPKVVQCMTYTTGRGCPAGLCHCFLLALAQDLLEAFSHINEAAPFFS